MKLITFIAIFLSLIAFAMTHVKKTTKHDKKGKNEKKAKVGKNFVDSIMASASKINKNKKH